MESKQPILSVMARLMGLDELPPQQPVKKKPRVLSENYLRRVASIGVREKCLERLSFRLSIEEQKEYKDVFPVLETLKRDNHHRMSVEKREVHSSSSEVKTTLASQKLLLAKHNSVDKMLQSSKKCHDVLKVIDSKTDNFLYLQEPELLFAKKVNDLQDAPCQSQIRHITVLKSLCASNCRDIVTCRKSWRIGEQEYANWLKKVENSLGTYSCGKLGLDDNKFSRSQLESNNGSCLPTTRIVVLKPNLRNMENGARCLSSSSSSHKVFHSADRKHKEILSTPNGNLYVEVTKRKNLANGMGAVRPRSRFSKEITRKMGHGISSISAEAIRGSTGDTLAKESEVMIPSSLVLSDRKNQHHNSGGSYVTREAKNQIRERWKTTKRFQQVELARKSKTLGEMLDIPDHESRPINLDNKAGKFGLSNQISLDSGDGNFGTPFGNSSWDGWNDGHARDLPRSRSLLVSFNAVGSPSTTTRHKSLQKGSYARAQESMNLVQLKPSEQDSNVRDGSECRNSESSYNESPSIPCSKAENNYFVEANHVIQNELENKLEEKDSHNQRSEVSKTFGSNNQTCQVTGVIQEGHENEGRVGHLSQQNSVVCMSSMSSVSSISMVADTLADAETEVVDGFPLYHEGLHLEPKNCILSMKDEDSSPPILDASVQHEQDISNGMPEGEYVSSCCSGTDPDTDPECLMSLKEAYQPSPVSVLEPLYNTEILSGSDCFKSVNASLHGLHMQLELLKSETSEAYSEGSGMMVSSDEDTGEGSVGETEEDEDLMRLFRVEDGRDFSYLVDVLTEAGFHGRNLYMGFDTWHSQECPMSSSVFETLEKKYGEQKSWKRSERRLLFDRINLGLMEILQPSIGVPAWTKPVARRFSSRMSQELIEEELWILLVSQENEASKDLEKVLGKDDRWLELGDDIQIIGREVENSLIDELVEDVVSMESF